MHLFQYLEIGGQRFNKNSFFITHSIWHRMHIFDRKHQVVGKGTIAIANAERCTVGAVRQETLLAIPTIWTTASCVDLANDTLPQKVVIPLAGLFSKNVFNDADKFMSQDAGEAQVPPNDFQVCIANACERDTNQSFSIDRCGVGIALL